MPLIPILTAVVGLIAAISVHIDGENKHYKCFFVSWQNLLTQVWKKVSFCCILSFESVLLSLLLQYQNHRLRREQVNL